MGNEYRDPATLFVFHDPATKAGLTDAAALNAAGLMVAGANPERAFELFSEAAQLGSHAGLLNSATCHNIGFGTTKDLDLALGSVHEFFKMRKAATKWSAARKVLASLS